MPDALVETWQADPDGRFAHPDDPRGGGRRSDFRGFGRCATDADGRYWIRTLKPGAVPAPDGALQAPHVDVSVFARGLLAPAGDPDLLPRRGGGERGGPGARRDARTRSARATLDRRGGAGRLPLRHPPPGTGRDRLLRRLTGRAGSSAALFGAPARSAREVGDRAWLRAMLDVEAALAARARRGAGLVPAEAAEAIAAACRAAGASTSPSWAATPRARRQPGRAAGAARCARPAAGRGRRAHVHRGATSQDVLDTAAMLVAPARARAAAGRPGRARPAARRGWPTPTGHTVMAGRTLLQQALPMTFGLKAAGWLVAARRGRGPASRGCATTRLAVQLGGAAGTLAALGDAGLAGARPARAGARPGRADGAVAHRPRPGRRARRGARRRGRACWPRSRATSRCSPRPRWARSPRAARPAAAPRPCRTSATRWRAVLRPRPAPAGARPRGHAARGDGPGARARGRRLARGVGDAAPSCSGWPGRRRPGCAPAPLDGLRGRPRPDAREPRRHRRAAHGRERRRRAGPGAGPRRGPRRGGSALPATRSPTGARCATRCWPSPRSSAELGGAGIDARCARGLPRRGGGARGPGAGGAPERRARRAPP